jgi:Tfp pilus assembly protein PilE
MNKILASTTSKSKSVKKNLRIGLLKDQRGVNVIEFLLIAAILVVLALIVIPNLNLFLGTDKKIAEANTEALNARAAALSYFNDEGVYPTDSDVLLSKDYIGQSRAYYTFDKGNGRILSASMDTIGHMPVDPWKGIRWDYISGSWVKQ